MIQLQEGDWTINRIPRCLQAFVGVLKAPEVGGLSPPNKKFPLGVLGVSVGEKISLWCVTGKEGDCGEHEG